MIDFGSFKTASCTGANRRSFLRTATTVPALAAAGLPALADIEAAVDVSGSP